MAAGAGLQAGQSHQYKGACQQDGKPAHHGSPVRGDEEILVEDAGDVVRQNVGRFHARRDRRHLWRAQAISRRSDDDNLVFVFADRNLAGCDIVERVGGKGGAIIAAPIKERAHLQIGVGLDLQFAQTQALAQIH
jgi:hypothetical protein